MGCPPVSARCCSCARGGWGCLGVGERGGHIRRVAAGAVPGAVHHDIDQRPVLDLVDTGGGQPVAALDRGAVHQDHGVPFGGVDDRSDGGAAETGTARDGQGEERCSGRDPEAAASGAVIGHGRGRGRGHSRVRGHGHGRVLVCSSGSSVRHMLCLYAMGDVPALVTLPAPRRLGIRRAADRASFGATDVRRVCIVGISC